MKKTRGDDVLFWSLAALAAGAAAWLVFGQRAYSVQNFEFYADRGESLFHAVRSKAVSYSMPLLSLLVSSARYHLGLEPGLLAKAAGALLALPAFAIGARGGGRARGALFALAALLAGLGGGSIEAEQVLYSLSLLVFLSVELLRQSAGGAALSAVSGLAAGLTLLVRSPLFAFPPLAALFQFFSFRPGLKKWLPATALFLACTLLPLMPWVRLNHSLFGRVILFEEERSTCNIITGASGVIYTIEGDARAFAGLSRTESPYPWAFRKILSSPGNYAGAVVKRLWQTFLMLWPLFLLAAAGFAFWRGPEARFLAFFCGYFVLLHCLLSIEERYFYPLKFPLALLAAGGAWELLKNRLPAGAAWRDLLTLPLLAALLLPAAWAMAVVWRYPGAAKPALIAVEEALKEHPADPWLHKKKGELLISFDLAGAGRGALRSACAAGGGADLCCLTAALEGAAPQACAGSESLYELLLVQTLRALEQDDQAEAARLFARARAHWLEERNGIKAMPYESDQKHLAKILETNKTLWDMDLYGVLLYWEPAARSVLIEKLARLTPLTPKLRAVMLAGRPSLKPGEKAELAALESRLGPELQASEFEWGANLRELNLELLRRGGEGRAGGALGLLLALGESPEEALANFGTGRPAEGAALRAAAEAYLAAPGDAAPARRLAATDPDNFAYALILLKASGFSEPALAEAAANLRRRPYPLAAAAALYAGRGRKAEALELAGEAARLGGLGEAGWQRALLAAQLAGDYAAGLDFAGRALGEHPGSPELLNARGMLKKLSGNAPGARADFEAAARGGKSFSALMNLGLELEAAGERERAAQVYGRAAAAAPETGARLAAQEAAGRAGAAR